MTIQTSNHFKKCFKNLPSDIQDLFAQKLKLLISSHLAHPSLRVKKMKGTSSIWEFSVTMNYRVTFEMIEGGIFLRKIGTHDMLNQP